MLKQWLRDALTTSGRTQKALADHLGLEPGAVSKMLSGVRQIKAEELVRITKFLKVDAPMSSMQTTPTVDVKVTAIAAAGVWRDQRGAAVNSDVAIPSIPNSRFKGLTQRAVKVDGDDFARTVKPGQFAVYVSVADMRRKPQVGDVVYIRRHRGDMVEHSLRRLFPNDHENVMELHSDPISGEPEVLIYPSMGRERIEIIGLCIGVYAPL